jgi:hypothetical protein
MKVTPNNPIAEFTCFQGIAIGAGIMIALAFLTGGGSVIREEDDVRVAMIGNSLMYYNDLPRLLEAMSGGKLTQDSCLHGAASFRSHLLYGNGMFVKWDTGNAQIWNIYNDDNTDASEAYQEYMDNNNNDDAQQQQSYQLDSKQSHIYDFGACSVRQLLLGVDERLIEIYESVDDDDDDNEDDEDNEDENENENENDNNNERRQRRRRRMTQSQRRQQRMQQHQHRRQQNKVRTNNNNTIVLTTTETELWRRQQQQQRKIEEANIDDYNTDDDYVDAAVSDDTYEYYGNYNYDDDYYFNTEIGFSLQNDGTNPCLLSANYYFYKQSQYDEFNNGIPKWDYILLNDNSRSPCCTDPRKEGIKILVDIYVPWFIETGAIPIFMVTHAYWSSSRDMSGLIDIPTFMSPI